MIAIYCEQHGQLCGPDRVRVQCSECALQGKSHSLFTYRLGIMTPVVPGIPPEETEGGVVILAISTPSQGVKYDAGKPAFELIPPHMEEELAKVLAYGARKYAPDNWKKVPGAKRRYMGAARRHMNAHRRGELRDPETGFLHLAHAAACLMFMGEFELANVPEIPESI